MLSAVISTCIFVLAQLSFPAERRRLFLAKVRLLYVHGMKRIFFAIDPEIMHERMTHAGERMGNNPLARYIYSRLFVADYPALRQTIDGIQFNTPIGLAAGFDYKARLTQILPSIGFGFQTIGTITNMPYEGNPKPMLGRLPQSRSLMVNKGFKNEGAKAIAEKMTGKTFAIPVGISIGRTNTLSLKTQKQSIQDILNAFTTFEESDVAHAYYELNISCPNLYGDITFYPPKNLKELLTEVDALGLSRPVFIKMPIEKPDTDVLEMLKVIANYSPAGVIFGNLQKDRKNPALVPSEVKKFKVGNFSGKPTYERSNQLIQLSYTHYADRFTIIGCGGVFSGADAYTKITLGASLVQLITGMIFQGPQLIASINQELDDLLKRDGFTNISQAVGSRAA